MVAAALALYAAVVRDHDDPGLSRLGSAAGEVHLAQTALPGAADEARRKRDRAAGRAADAEAAARAGRSGGAGSAEGLTVLVGDEPADTGAGGTTPSGPGTDERGTPRRRGGSRRRGDAGPASGRKDNTLARFTRPSTPTPAAPSSPPPPATNEPSNRDRDPDDQLSVRDDDDEDVVVQPDDDTGGEPVGEGPGGDDADRDQDPPGGDDHRWGALPGDDCDEPGDRDLGDDDHGDDRRGDAPEADAVAPEDAAAPEPPAAG